MPGSPAWALANAASIACLLQLVEILNRYKSTKVVVIADECGINEQFKATQIAGHLKGRLRIVAIDNSEIPPGRAGVIALERVEDGHLREILAINFPGVPSESRDHYAAIAGGYIRFAADLCRQHPRIVADGHFGRASFSIRQYLSFRLGGRLETLAALSLVLKVGWVARHLPGPKEVEGEVVLPDVTRELIELYAGDEHFGGSVVAGIESMRVSVGSLSQSRIRRAALYEQVANKYDGAVKEWAREQVLSLRQQAERWRIREDEENSPQDL